jgi:hypothetical protein
MSRLRSRVVPAAASTSLRRLIIGCSAAALLLAGGTLASSTAVQATTPPTEEPAEGDPIVGAWLLTVDEFPDDPPQLVAVHADGTFHAVDADGVTGIGSWEATGPSSFNLTFIAQFATDDVGSVWMQTIRAAGEVSEDGQSFTAEFTVEYTGEGAPAGEYGPGHVTATRINVEPIGTPAGSLEDLFAQLEGTAPAGTAPAGTAPVDTTPAGTEPVGTTPAGTEPVVTEPVETAPAGTEPVGTTPGDAAVATTTG